MLFFLIFKACIKKDILFIMLCGEIFLKFSFLQIKSVTASFAMM